MRLGQISIIDRNFQFNFTPHIRFDVHRPFICERTTKRCCAFDWFQANSSSNFYFYFYYVPNRRGYSSVVEHPTADRNVPGSTPGVPCEISYIGRWENQIQEMQWEKVKPALVLMLSLKSVELKLHQSVDEMTVEQQSCLSSRAAAVN